MAVKLALFFCLFCGYDRSDGELLDSDIQPQQWHDVVTLINQKINHIENLMNTKDERLANLESKILTQDSEISSLKKLMIHKDAVVNHPTKQVEDLKKSEFMNTNFDTSRSKDNTKIIPVSSTSFNSTSVTTNSPIAARGDPDTRQSDGEGDDYNTERHLDDPDVVTKLKRSNRVAPTPTVAFHAYLTSTVTLGTQATVIFNHEALDQGNGYNPTEGIYTVPQTGTYVITWNMYAYGRNAFQTLLVVNGATRGMSWTDSDEISDAHQSTGVTVLILNQGDHLYIRMGQIYHGKIFSDSSYGQPTISGWKLD